MSRQETITGMAPKRVLRIQHNDLKDALEACCDPVPVDPDQWSKQATADVLRRLYAAIAQVEQIEHTLDNITAGREAAVRGMCNDIGAAGYEWPWES